VVSKSPFSVVAPFLHAAARHGAADNGTERSLQRSITQRWLRKPIAQKYFTPHNISYFILQGFTKWAWKKNLVGRSRHISH